jgi:hypothetical protein
MFGESINKAKRQEVPEKGLGTTSDRVHCTVAVAASLHTANGTLIKSCKNALLIGDYHSILINYSSY